MIFVAFSKFYFSIYNFIVSVLKAFDQSKTLFFRQGSDFKEFTDPMTMKLI